MGIPSDQCQEDYYLLYNHQQLLITVVYVQGQIRGNIKARLIGTKRNILQRKKQTFIVVYYHFQL